MRSRLAGLLPLAAAACDSSAPSPDQAALQAPAANLTASARATGAVIAALPEAQREATFYRAIHDAGMDCQQVTGASPGGTYHGLPVWNATCRGGGHWTLVIGGGDTVQVLNANESRLVTDRPPT